MKKHTPSSTIEVFREVSKEVTEICSGLNAEQLNWKPNPKSWSVGQVLDHLITSNALYHDMFQKLPQGNYKAGFGAYLPFLPGFFGKFLINGLQPGKVGNMPAPKSFQPSLSHIPAEIVSVFLDSQKEMEALIRPLEKLNLVKTKVTSPAGAFIGYSLEDLVTILAVHELRHLLQVKRVMKADGFPQH